MHDVLTEDHALLFGGSGNDALTSVYGSVIGGGGNDSLQSSSFRLWGGGGDDTITGGRRAEPHLRWEQRRHDLRRRRT